MKVYGQPKVLRSDSGSEFTSRSLAVFLNHLGTKPHFIKLGSPWQNGLIESFHSRLKAACMDAERSRNQAYAKHKAAACRGDSIQNRSESSLGYRAMANFANLFWDSHQNHQKYATLRIRSYIIEWQRELGLSNAILSTRFMFKPSRSLFIIGTCAVLTGLRPSFAQSNSQQNVWQAWKNTIAKSQSLGAYKLTGTNQAYAGPDNARPAMRVAWDSVVSGSKYKVVWSLQGGGTNTATYVQSFDGKLLYGATTTPSGQHALVTDRPVNTAGVDLQKHLLNLSAGLFYPTATQVFTMFENFGAKNLLDKYLSVADRVTVTIKGRQVSLVLNHNDAIKYNLPDEMDLKFVGNNIYPVKTVILPRGNALTTICEARQYSTYGTGFEYPREIDRRFVSENNGIRKTIYHSETKLTINKFNPAHYSFAIRFAPNARIARILNGKITMINNDKERLSR